jgi:6-phosphogluconolactonase
MEAAVGQYLFVSLFDDDVIARFDTGGGMPERRRDFEASGGPAPLAVNPGKTRLFAGMRKSRELVCMRIGDDAGLVPASRTALPGDPCFLGTDRRGRHVFSAYYRAGQIAVHRWDEESDRLTETERISTEPNAHSVWIDREDRQVYAPHTGPNKIYRYRFDAAAGTLSPEDPPWVAPGDRLEPRHLCFHPLRGDLLYGVNEGSSTVSVYDLDRTGGMIRRKKTVSTLPDPGIPGNSCAEIRISPDGRFLYASNRGHNSIACFSIGGPGGDPVLIECVPAPAVPRSFDISPDGAFLYAAGQDSGELAVYARDRGSGRLRECARPFIGHGPLWVMGFAP